MQRGYHSSTWRALDTMTRPWHAASPDSNKHIRGHCTHAHTSSAEEHQRAELATAGWTPNPPTAHAMHAKASAGHGKYAQCSRVSLDRIPVAGRTGRQAPHLPTAVSRLSR